MLKISNMNRFNIFLLFLFIIGVASCTEQKQEQTSRYEIFATPAKSGGTLYAYPCNEITSKTPAPEGYQPFHISYFGRHGSRYLVSDGDYKNILEIFMQADSSNVLTELGKNVLLRLSAIWLEAEGNGGKLSPLGERQMKEIAERMYRQYPDVFAEDSRVSAVSTVVERCIHSMEILCSHLSELRPQLSVSWDADPRHTSYLNHNTEEATQFRSSQNTWRIAYDQFVKEHVHSQRLFTSLFNDDDFLRGNTDADYIMWELFNVANSLQNMQTDVSLYDLFEKQELFDLWQCRNYSLYVQYANAAENSGIMMKNAIPLLQNIIDSANYFIKNTGKGATLRFGHDGNIIPLAALLHLENCYNSVNDAQEFYKAWSDFKVAPMGSNIQIIFFRKDADSDVLVKFLHNENETLIPPVKSDIPPYYRWRDLLEFYSVITSP